MFIKPYLVPIIKNRTGNTSNKNNYRSIALVTTASINLELCLSEIIEDYLVTHDKQVGLKKKTFNKLTVKSVTKNVLII